MTANESETMNGETAAVASEAPPPETPDTGFDLPEPRRVRCAVTGKSRPKRQLVAVRSIRPAIATRIRADHPDLKKKDLVDRRVVNRYRSSYVDELLHEEQGEFDHLDRQVTESITHHETIAENVEEEFDEHRTLGERFSDILAQFGGSWAFLISFAVVLAVWMAVNLFQGQTKAFDPYPFILLNLVLSTLAAIQAPIIMMSQRRQEEKDRLRSLNDYRVNLKAELEIRHLHDKLDYLITRQWKRLAEIQQLQLEIMQERRWRK